METSTLSNPGTLTCFVCRQPIEDPRISGCDTANAQWRKGEYLNKDVKFIHKGDCSHAAEDAMPSWKDLADYLDELESPDADALEAERGEVEKLLADVVLVADVAKAPITAAKPKTRFDELCADQWQQYADIPSRSEAVQSVLTSLAFRHECDEDVMRIKFERTPLCQAWGTDKGEEAGAKWARLGDTEITNAIKFAKAHPRDHKKYEDCEAEAPRVLKVIRFSSLKPEPIHWMWKGYLAERKLTMLNGEPGHGKSLVSLDIAARATTGRPWADGQPNTLPPSSVILLTEEEDAADTILPRFLAAGGDPSKLATITVAGGDYLFSIEDDLPQVENLMDEDTKLVILDPVADYTKAKQNVDSEVRPVLNKLAKWAREHDLAVLGINHLNKKTDLQALHRVAGARAWVSVARLNFLLGKGQQNGTRHICPLKLNLAPDGNGSLDYEIHSATIEAEGELIDVPVIGWKGKGTATVDDLTAVKPQQAGGTDMAEVFLKQALQPWGEWKASAPIIAKAWETAQISQDRLQKWLKRLGGEHRNTQTVPRRTEWRLPAKADEAPDGTVDLPEDLD